MAKILEIIRKIKFRLNKRVIHSKPIGPAKGQILLSYITLPFISPDLVAGHTNRWECQEVVRIFNRHGYAVDIIDFTNQTFQPRQRYDFCIDIQNNLERLAPLLNPDCKKIFHITTAHWQFNNQAELARLTDIKKKRGYDLKPNRQLPPTKNIELADMATILGNEFTIGTYAYAGKKIHPLHISTTHTYPEPKNKNFTQAKKHFVWLGGAGMAHKGLDLVLETFAALPEYHLTICGKKDPDFAAAYHKELFETPNIEFVGHLDFGGDKFIDIVNQSIGLIFPSCSEGSSGGVVTAMHAGLIPVISFQSGVNVGDFGIILKENTIEEITAQITHVANMTDQELARRAMAAWSYARAYHTREQFAKDYENFIKTLI